MSGRSGIYAIVNKLTGGWYVGQSMNMARRRHQHWSELRAGRHGCRRLQRSFAKHGEHAFVFSVMEYADISDLDRREQQYLDAGFACGTLYNSARCAEAPARGAKRSPEICAANGVAKRALFSDPEVRRALGKKIALTLSDPSVRAKMRTPRSDAGRAAISVAQARRYSTPEGMAGHAAAMASRGEHWLQQIVARGRRWRSNREWVARHDEAIRSRSENPEWRARIAMQNKAFAAEPGWRAAVKAGHSTEEARRNHGEATRRTWAARRADPVAYAAWCQKIKDGLRRKRDGVNV